MAVTPRQVKTLSEEELQWLTQQIKAIDRQVYAHYDGNSPLEIVLPPDPDRRAFLHEALYRRVRREYIDSGWQVETQEHPTESRSLWLSEVSPPNPSAHTKQTEGEVAPPKETLPATAETELTGAICSPRRATNNPPNTHQANKEEAIEGPIHFEEEVETLWGTGEEDEETELDASGIREPPHGLAVDLLEESYNRLAPRAQEWSAQFYQRLQGDNPELAPFFAEVNLKELQQHFINALALVINNLRTPDRLDASLGALGRRHHDYGITQEHYLLMGATLLCVMEEFSGDRWTEAIQKAWQGAIDYISEVMMTASQSTPS